MLTLLRQIVQRNPPITYLNMRVFSGKDDDDNIGELVLEILLNSSIDTIIDLNLSENRSWFKNPRTREDKLGNVDLLLELILK